MNKRENNDENDEKMTLLIELMIKVVMIKRRIKVGKGVVLQLHLLKQELSTIVLIILSL